MKTDETPPMGTPSPLFLPSGTRDRVLAIMAEPTFECPGCHRMAALVVIANRNATCTECAP